MLTPRARNHARRRSQVLTHYLRLRADNIASHIYEQSWDKKYPRTPTGPSSYPARIELEQYAWPGGYTVEYLTRQGSILCAHCATEAIRQHDDDPPTHMDTYDEGPAMECDGCGYWLISSYGDPEQTDEQNDLDRETYEALNREIIARRERIATP